MRSRSRGYQAFRPAHRCRSCGSRGRAKERSWAFSGPTARARRRPCACLCGLLRPDEGKRYVPRLRRHPRSAEDQARSGLYDPALQLLRRPFDPRKLELRGNALWPQHARARVDDTLEHLGTEGARQPARGNAVGRLEAAARARCFRHARAAASASRRAHGGRRSQGAARILGRDPRAGRKRASPRLSARITWTRPSAVTA